VYFIFPFAPIHGAREVLEPVVRRRWIAQQHVAGKAIGEDGGASCNNPIRDVSDGGLKIGSRGPRFGAAILN
jgi:hypothetical protein